MDSQTIGAMWCAGMPFAARRALSDDEKRRLQETAARSRRRGWAYVKAALGLPALTFVGTAFFDGNSPAAEALAIASGLELVVLAPILGLCARDGFRRARFAGADATAGEALRFAGPVEEPMRNEEAAHRLTKAGILHGGAEPQSLELLAVSHAVWQANDADVAKWLIVPVVGVAETPSYAATAADWMEPVSGAADETLYANARDLSAEEVAEINAHARRFFRQGIFATLLINYALTLRGAGLYASGSKALAIACFSGAAALQLHVLALLRIATRLRRDARFGRVAVFRVKVEPTEEAPEEYTEPVEMLPAARRVWTEDGLPAAWRKYAA